MRSSNPDGALADFLAILNDASTIYPELTPELQIWTALALIGGAFESVEDLDARIVLAPAKNLRVAVGLCESSLSSGYQSEIPVDRLILACNMGLKTKDELERRRAAAERMRADAAGAPKSTSPVVAAAQLLSGSKRDQTPDHEAFLREVERNGGSPLHYHAAISDAATVEAMLSSGDEPSLRDKRLDTPLHLALRSRNQGAARLLLKTSSWAAVNSAGRTPIDEALFKPSGERHRDSLADFMIECISSVMKDGPAADPVRCWACMRLNIEDKTVCAAMDELMQLVGLRGVKDEILSLYKGINLDKERPEGAKMSLKQAYNFIFVGNPGTGKTTVARIVARILRDLGLREGETCIEKTGQGLLDGGSTKFKDVLASALPGVLFIDEVYQLDPKSNADGRAITNSIMQATEDERTRLTVIVAGYKDDVEQKWLASNDGLPSRFPIRITFDDFNESELRSIFMSYIRSAQWTLEPSGPGGVDIATIAARRLARGSGRRGFANARSVRVLFETAQRKANERLMKTSKRSASELTMLVKRDVIGSPIDPGTSNAVKKLMRMPGLHAVKDAVTALLQLASDNFEREEQGKPVQDLSMHRMFLGNPGTGVSLI